MKPKKFLCLCEDVTTEDVENAVNAGLRDIDLLKRYTHMFTGPCQAKCCLNSVVELLSQLLHENDTETIHQSLRIPTLRPPFKPVRLTTLAGEDVEG
jgi:bacterioferritin-associated ferredoxin